MFLGAVSAVMIVVIVVILYVGEEMNTINYSIYFKLI